MGDRIYKTNFRELDGLTLSFNMTNHLNAQISQVNSLPAICETISGYHKSMFPNWTRLMLEFRIIKITETNDLFQYLDATPNGRNLFWLIVSRVGDHVNVTRFGPFGNTEDKEFEDKVKETRLTLGKLKDCWLQVSSLPLPKKEENARQNAITNDVKKNFGAMMQAVEKQIEAKKEELKEAVMSAVDSKESRKYIGELIIKITTKSRACRKVLDKVMKEIAAEIAKVIAKTAAKQVAKQCAKAVSKGAAKTTAKAVPFVGLALGIGFAVWRLTQGDVVGAGLEITSGAASCVPGSGTVTSFAIDATLVAKDVKNANDLAKKKKEKMEDLKVKLERITGELNELFTKNETAKAEHDFVCEVLGDHGYDFEKLEHDIGVVDEVLLELHSN